MSAIAGGHITFPCSDEHSGKQYAYTQLPLRGQRQNDAQKIHEHALTSQLVCEKITDTSRGRGL